VLGAIGGRKAEARKKQQPGKIKKIKQQEKTHPEELWTKKSDMLTR